jgi:tRNA 5-methylaminomethyl-2-thiouridine biosynthesis bifunctional protein
MNRDNLPWRSVEPAILQWNDQGEPFSEDFGDLYFSRGNGLEEGTHVFLQGNGLPQRWKNHPHKHFCVGETGFGTGLNFLLTWQAWRDLPEPRPDLHYLSIEKHPLSREDLARVLALWPALDFLSQPLLNAYPGLLAGQHRLLLDDGRVRLDLWWEDAAATLQDLVSRKIPLVDAWYLDGFAPACNADMWSAAVLDATAALSRPGATFATFTAAGHVRRTLLKAGFRVDKSPGYGRKRECLRGVLNTSASIPEETPRQLPWDIANKTIRQPNSALIIGGGLAGCSAAAALARRGIAVTLLEQGTLASAGSAIDQGILYTRLSRKHSALTDFALQSFQFATNFYHSMFATGQLKAKQDGDLCGNFQQSDNARDMAELRDALAGLEDLAQVLDAGQANTVLGIEQSSGGYWFPRSGWLCPAAVCRALLDQPGIQVVENCGEVSLNFSDGSWRAVARDKTLAQADCAIAATGTGITAMEQCHWLRLQTIRGQITQLPTDKVFKDLDAALCHEGYIAPAREGNHSIGATFDIDSSHPALRSEDHRHNLTSLANAVPAWRETLDSLDSNTLEGRVGHRCASPDYLPVVGPVPDLSKFLEDFGSLRKDAKLQIARHGSYLPGLYISSAHGSRGLTSTPLAAELLASMICEEPLPVSRVLSRALAPARFIIRDLSRNRI